MGKIGSELGVRYLVEGSVRRVGDRVRVTVQLIDARTDDHLWAENYDRTLEDIFAIQSAVAKEIAGQLQAMISPEEEAEIDELPTTNMEAYDLFLRTRNRAPLAEDADLLEKAVDLDPEFLDAWVQLTYNRLFRWRITGRLNDDLLSDAMTAYDQVSRLAKDSNEVSWLEESIAFNMDDDLEGALLMALKNNKEKAIGLRSIQLGRLEEADHYLEEGLKGSPFDLITLHRAYTTKIYLGKFDEAYKKLKVALDFMDPLEGPSFLLYFEAQHDYLEKGDRREFVNALEALGYNEDLRFMLMKASVTHDFTAVLEALENNSIRLGVRDRALWSTLGFKLLNYSVGTDVGYTLKPDHLLSALIRFEMGGGKHLAGSVEKARQYWESINNGYPRKDPTNLASLALCYALEGDRERMEALLPEIRELTGNVNWQFRRQVPCELLIAMAYVVLGDHDKAIETLEAASTMNGCLLLNRELNVWFIFDRLRGDPRFEALLQ
jgi:tetratricopeptide (TPR) repeat protein